MNALLRITIDFYIYNRILIDFLFFIYMMENLWPEEEKIIKDIRNLFRLGKETKVKKRDTQNRFEHDINQYE